MTLQMPIDIRAALDSARHVVITAHERPDGDALGSSLGLRRILAARGIKARVVGLHPIPPRYEFMLTAGEVEPAAGDWAGDADVVIALDCGAMDRLGAFVRDRPAGTRFINIDHHDSNTHFGSMNWVDPTASSVGEMIVRFARHAGYDIPRAAAEALWVAIVTDTGRFSFENTSAAVLRLAADLLDCGVEPARVAGHVYHSVTEAELRLSERALGSLRLDEGGQVASVVLTEADFISCGCGPEDAHDVVDIPRRIAGVKVGFFCYELAGQGITKVSARSVPPYNVAHFCRFFGGGGHKRAAGCTMTGDARSALETVLFHARQMWFSDGMTDDERGDDG